MHNIGSGEKKPKNVGYFCNFQKTILKVNNHPLGESSPNLVTLFPLPPHGKQYNHVVTLLH
jgi:hypothetical protein